LPASVQLDGAYYDWISTRQIRSPPEPIERETATAAYDAILLSHGCEESVSASADSELPNITNIRRGALRKEQLQNFALYLGASEMKQVRTRDPDQVWKNGEEVFQQGVRGANDPLSLGVAGRNIGLATMLREIEGRRTISLLSDHG